MIDLPGYWTDHLEGKRICIVGNAPSITSTRIPIDEHDVIFRFNDNLQGGEWGTRTSYYCTTMRKEVRTAPNSVRAKAIPLVFTGRNPVGSYDLSWGFSGVDLERSLGCWPSSGLMAVHIACASMAEHVTLAAMTLAPTLIRESTWPPRYAPPWVYHNFLGERRVLSQLLQTAKCSMDLPPALDPLRRCASSDPGSLWAPLASALEMLSHAEDSSGQVKDPCNGPLSSKVFDFMQWVSNSLSGMEPCMAGVRQVEPFFFLPTERSRHPERWLLFHAVGAQLMDDILVRLRRLQTLID